MGNNPSIQRSSSDRPSSWTASVEPILVIPKIFVLGPSEGIACNVPATSAYTRCGSTYSYCITSADEGCTCGMCTFNQSRTFRRSAIHSLAVGIRQRLILADVPPPRFVVSVNVVPEDYFGA